jgi:hypothetical protein
VSYCNAALYNKIFTKILDSSIWLEPDATRIVWLTCIAAMDEDGFVQFASVANLARRANVSLKAAELAVTRLEGPDSESSDPEHEGRRIERVQGGWIVLNAQKYRSLVTREVAREQTRIRVQRHRAKRAGNGSNGKAEKSNGVVTPSEAVSEARSETEAKNAAAAFVRPAFKERPMPGYRRLKLLHWMWADMIGILGDHLEAFDLEAWMQAIDHDGSRVIPKTWPWLREELIAECHRRGLLKASDSSPVVSPARLEYEAWKAAGGCTHEPRCSSYATCQVVSQRKKA